MRGLLAGAVVLLLGFAAPVAEVGPIIFFYTFDGSGIGASPGKAR